MEREGEHSMKKIKLITFPHLEGHHEAVLDLETITKEDVFGKTYPKVSPMYHGPSVEYTVMVGDTVVKDWDDLIKIVDGKDMTEPVEVTRFKPIVGG